MDWLGAAFLGGLIGSLLIPVFVILVVPDSWLRATPRGHLDDADVIIALALGLGGTPDSPSAGLSNEAIAWWIVEHNPEFKPMLAQWGVALALQQLAPHLMRWVIVLPHHPAIYVNTRDAALQCWALMDSYGWKRPLLVAHHLQLQRMAWEFDKLHYSDQSIVPDLPTIPFDANSIQHWGTRSRRGWLIWELFFARPLTGCDRRGLIAIVGVGLLGALIGWLLA